MNLLDYVSDMRQRAHKAWEIARKNLTQAQSRMKTWFDKKTKNRQFNVGEKVLALLPIPYQPLQARYSGPYVITKKVSKVDYIIDTPDRRKSQRLCHINMLKAYHQRSKETTNQGDNPDTPSQVLCLNVQKEDNSTSQTQDSQAREFLVGGSPKLRNSDVLKRFQTEKLGHLDPVKQGEMMQLIFQFVTLFPDTPSRTNFHDVDVGSATPNTLTE